MSNILLVTSSPRGADSLSNKLAADLAGKLSTQAGSKSIVHRDLVSQPLPHIDGVFAAAWQRRGI